MHQPTTDHQARKLLDSTPRKTGRPRHKTAPWICVSGGKGGVGKTLIAVNLAILTQRCGYRTLLVDLDPGLPNVDVHLRMAPRWTIEDVVDGHCSAAEAIVTGPGGIGVLCGRSGSTRLAQSGSDFLDRVLAVIDQAATDYDAVICDTGAGIGPAVLGAAARATLVLAVTTAEPAAITDTYALCKLLLSNRSTVAPPRILINRVRGRDEAMRTSGRLALVCERFLGRRLELAGWLRNDPSLQNSVADQRPYAANGFGPVMEDLRAITANALSGLPGLLRRNPR